MDRIKRLSTEILSEYKDSFGTDFSENKKMLNEITIVRSKGLKNKIAGYITKILLREHKFQVRKQKLIDDEKKSMERNRSQEKASTPEPETVDVESTDWVCCVVADVVISLYEILPKSCGSDEPGKILSSSEIFSFKLAAPVLTTFPMVFSICSKRS